MNAALTWLLRLDTLRLGEEGVELGWTHPIPAWGWALVIAAAALAAGATYRRLEGQSLWRGALAGLRALLLVLLAVLIAGPKLVKPNETEEKDWVLVLADRSASMGVRDAPPAGPPPAPGLPEAPRATRDEELARAVSAAAPAWERLAKDRVLVWLGFDAGAYDLKPARAGGAASPASIPDLGPAQGRRTAIGRALDGALRRAAARPLAGVVLLSDGRSVDEPGRAALRRLQAERVPVFPVALGSARGLADVAVRTVEGPRQAFVNDLVPVSIEVERRGVAGSADPARPWGRIQLVDRATGFVLDEKEVGGADAAPVSEGAQAQRVTLTARPGQADAGAGRWQVRLVPPAADAAPGATGAWGQGDLIAENNAADLDVELVDRPLRVLYFDGYPRWEYRYLKNLLIREKSITSSAMILAPGRRFIQEGDETLALPATPEEWRRFDVVVIGDVRPDVFTPEQLVQLREHVAADGAGLLWIGGESSTPGAWASTPLADLLPFSMTAAEASAVGGSSPRTGPVSAWPEPVVARPTPAADRLGVMRLADAPDHGSWWPAYLSDPATGWSRLRWAQRIAADRLKPTAEVLATAGPDLSGPSQGGGPTPRVGAGGTTGAAESALVLTMRFGAGRTVYVGTDEVWRWRYGRGESLPEKFWLQMVRLLGRESVARSGRSARLEVAPVRAEVEQPVRIAVELIDQRLLDAAPASIRVRLTRVGAPGGKADPGAGAAQAGTDLVLAPETAAGPARPGAGGAARTFAGTWIGTESGRYRVEAADALLAGQGLSADVDVWLPDDELRRPEADHALLARLAESTGGRVLTPDELNDLEKLLPNRRVRLVGTPEESTLWDTPLALLLALTLLTLEWVGRRLLRLA